MDFIQGEIISPLLRRAGTAFAGYLVSVGVTGNEATTIAAGVVAAASVGLDLILSHRNRRR